jgi:hypothetical protein
MLRNILSLPDNIHPIIKVIYAKFSFTFEMSSLFKTSLLAKSKKYDRLSSKESLAVSMLLRLLDCQHFFGQLS